jgi:hypothetical protein
LQHFCCFLPVKQRRLATTTIRRLMGVIPPSVSDFRLGPTIRRPTIRTTVTIGPTTDTIPITRTITTGRTTGDTVITEGIRGTTDRTTGDTVIMEGIRGITDLILTGPTGAIPEFRNLILRRVKVDHAQSDDGKFRRGVSLSWGDVAKIAKHFLCLFIQFGVLSTAMSALCFHTIFF